ncbi:peptide chain release factor N(5)-glutamine methyltransferase [Luteipulveratus sp. YIM 133132]|uniref:Release factor glutamine methyltransferase n=1 Tax=Luteipulveratus flavus TaxID=3031728 RepID=A0ABT6C8C1_9MICO|nr:MULTISPECIES: peptide chain release factor N(5)-glutamine methyltransferase [unclassified Luteipulveratus]MDE9365928.1 peptide chain release factor N(5)-glutamine methyltransferase [Luteipulveratus sp. YIM 133132]MDF8265118.1 peptide chain release factor N(5)-glutamine methyltransferase [Luteipulveratus sp. YIM 133296]
MIRTAAARLAEAGVGSPEHDALALLAHAWGRSVSDVRHAMVMGREPEPEVVERFTDMVDQRADRVPLQHLTGVAGFRGLELAVGPGVFVPRPETELLVDLVLDGLAPGALVVDLCTGSGAVPLAVKHERPDVEAYAVELDPLAFAWAERNRERLGLDVEMRCGAAQSAFPELDTMVDVVVSNPPYIPVGMEPVDPEVRDHDPEVALYGGSEDGLRIPLEVAARAWQLLPPGGRLVMEHADVQGDSLPSALRRAGWRDVADHRDLTGRPRAVTARRGQRG